MKNVSLGPLEQEVMKCVWNLPAGKAGNKTCTARDVVECLDDISALKIVDGKVEVISEGNYLTFNLLQ